jgi:methionyl-tRNA formyltransferase
MSKIDIYLCGHKGAACAAVIANEFSEFINTAIVENDTTLKVNPYAEMVSTLKAAGINVSEKIGKNPAETAIAVGWRRMIRHEYRQLVILHDSLLPKYRGWNPLLTALNNGDSAIGVTALLGNSEMDTGPIVMQLSAKISYPIRLARAIEIVSSLSAEIVANIIDQVVAGKKLKGKAQDEKKATYSLWRDKQDFGINWNQSAVKIQRHIDSCSSPYAGASAMLDGEIVKIERAEVVKIKPKIENPTAGKIWQLVDGMPIVVCASGFLKITELSSVSGKDLLPLTKLRQRFE